MWISINSFHIVYTLQVKPVIESRAFKDGLISIQDKSSMLVGYLMDVQKAIPY